MKQAELSDLSTADLFRQLALLIHAGVSLNDGCFLLMEEENDKAVRALLKDTAQHLESGGSLASALRKSGGFPAYVTGLLETGERVGRMEESLFALAHHYQEQHDRKCFLRNAITYPAVLLLLMMVVIVVLLTKVLPVFEDIYASLGGNLTGIAGSLLSFGNLLNDIMPTIIFILPVVMLICVLYFSIRPLRRLINQVYLHIFGDIGISRKINNARFAQALAMGMSSGLPLEDSVSLAAMLLADVPGAVRRCQACRDRLEAGDTLADALNSAKMLPASACRLLVLGVRAGSGDTTMQQIARRLSDDARDAVRSAVSRIEPALVVITSLLVGAILLSVMLPLMNIMKAIG